MEGVLCQNKQYQIEWLTIEWLTKLNGLPNWLAHLNGLWILNGPPSIECRGVREEPGVYSAPTSRRRDFFKYGYDKVFWVAPGLEYRRVLVYPLNQNTSVFGILSGHKDRSK